MEKGDGKNTGAAHEQDLYLIIMLNMNVISDMQVYTSLENTCKIRVKLIAFLQSVTHDDETDINLNILVCNQISAVKTTS